ncbi:MAG: hypothetical protein KDK29_18300, partial [Sedimentitalea sp.]|nr:hypothetical protein [Sedimentitalea sp.]
KELIRRKPDKSDGRRQIIRITPRGAELIAGNLDRSVELMTRIRDRMGPERYEALLDLLNELDQPDSEGGGGGEGS